jgi:glucan phosphorylase
MDFTPWFDTFKKSPDYENLIKKPIAYFCAEFALEPHIPTFAGGLGVLAGDFVQEAARQNIPLVAVGLYYHQGYTYNEITLNGEITQTNNSLSPENSSLKPVLDKENQRLIIEIPIQENLVKVQAWQWQVGQVKVYLLDTNLAQNSGTDRQITNKLYVPEKDMRIKQEILIGIGGFRLLKALNVEPSIYHLNEGHSAFVILELAKHEMVNRKISFNDALQFAREHIVFTNHTLVPAGQEIFDNDLVSTMLLKYSQELQIPVSEIVNLGLVHESSLFSMTMLSLRNAEKSNAVSQIHAEKAAEIWTNHPMEKITNGIYIPDWDKITPEAENRLWERHQHNKSEVLELVKKTSGDVWKEDTLLIGWGRRITGYKRPLALFADPDRFLKLMSNSNTEFRVVISGIAHEADKEAIELLKEMYKLISGKLKGYVVYIPNYNLEIAKLLTAGCDIWLNTPAVGFEACGTSGMKAALNGVLPVSTGDGWIYETETYGVGWRVDDANLTENLLSVLESKILPLYHSHLASRENSIWLNMMNNCRQMVLNQFGTKRMLSEYIEKLYIPVLSSFKNHHASVSS